MKVAPYNLRRQFGQLRDQIMASLERVCCRGEFVLGQEVELFEKEFADHCQAAQAVAVNSGTSALHLALLAAGVGPGHEVLTTPLTCAATCEAIAYTGAVPVFVDVGPDTGTLDPTRLAAAWSTRAKAVVPVHLYGFPADLDGIGAFAAATNLSVVEDASHAHGASYRGRRIGSSARLSIFSFGPEQNLGAYGTGGVVVTNDSELARTLRLLRDHGRSGPHLHELIGYNYGMGALEAAVLRVKLRHLRRWTIRRRTIAERYYEGLVGCPVRMLMPPARCEASWHLVPIVVPARDALKDHLGNKQIATADYCPIPMHLQPANAHLGYRKGDFPNAERLARESLFLPIYPELREDEIAHVVGCIRSYFGLRARRPSELGDMPARMVTNARFRRIGDVIRAFWAPRCPTAPGRS